MLSLAGEQDQAQTGHWSLASQLNFILLTALSIQNIFQWIFELIPGD